MQRMPIIVAAAAIGISVVVLAALAGRAPAGPLPAMPALAPNWAVADRVELSHAGSSFTLERRGQVWGLAREAGYPIRADRAAALVAALLSLTLLREADAAPDALGLGDPAASEGGTLVRVRAASGAVIGAIIVPVRPGANYVRRPREEQAWVGSAPVPASLDPADWADRRLPPAAPAEPGVAGEPALRALLDGLPILEVRAGPQVRPAAVRTVTLTLADGTATLLLGALDGQLWLHVAGTSRWAGQLAPYAFALPPDSPLAAAPIQ